MINQVKKNYVKNLHNKALFLSVIMFMVEIFVDFSEWLSQVKGVTLTGFIIVYSLFLGVNFFLYFFFRRITNNKQKEFYKELKKPKIKSLAKKSRENKEAYKKMLVDLNAWKVKNDLLFDIMFFGISITMNLLSFDILSGFYLMLIYFPCLIIIVWTYFKYIADLNINLELLHSSSLY